MSLPQRTIISGLAAVLVFAVVVLVAWSANREQTARLPARVVVHTASEAFQQAFLHTSKSGGLVVPVLGTGSMAPFIPAAPAGAHPLETVVAFVSTNPASTFDSIQTGDLCIYAPEGGPSVLHVAAARDGDAWIATGLANRRSDNAAGWRITRANFVGVVDRVFLWLPVA